MYRHKAQVSTGEKGISNKLKLGFAGAVATTVIGAAGIAAAAHSTTNNDPPSSTPAVVNYCKANYQQLGYKNLGQCVSHLNGHGHGYGG